MFFTLLSILPCLLFPECRIRKFHRTEAEISKRRKLQLISCIHKACSFSITSSLGGRNSTLLTKERKKCQDTYRGGAPLLWGKADRNGAFQSEEKAALGEILQNLPIHKELIQRI